MTRRSLPMKSIHALFMALIMLVTAYRVQAQTLEWGSEVFSDLVDSKEQALDETFIFQLGAFEVGFVPDETNVSEWSTRWVAFSQAGYNQDLTYFTGTATMNDDGSSSYDPGSGIDFSGLEAYIWIRNGDIPVGGTEWLLVRKASWVFPIATPGCCDNQEPLQWSISQLESGDTPVWGSQGGVDGGGVFTSTGNQTLQTFTFVPEPGSLLLASASLGLLLRRRMRR